MSPSPDEVLLALAAQEGTELFARSQAKRVMARCEDFRHVTLDFAGVDVIGPAFADEIFRVHALAHPEVELKWIHAAPAVEGRIRHARSNAS